MEIKEEAAQKLGDGAQRNDSWTEMSAAPVTLHEIKQTRTVAIRCSHKFEDRIDKSHT